MDSLRTRAMSPVKDNTSKGLGLETDARKALTETPRGTKYNKRLTMHVMTCIRSENTKSTEAPSGYAKDSDIPRHCATLAGTASDPLLVPVSRNIFRFSCFAHTAPQLAKLPTVVRACRCGLTQRHDGSMQSQNIPYLVRSCI